RANATTNVPPLMLTVTPLADSLSSSTWVIGQNNNTIPNVTDGVPVSLANHNFNADQPIVISHHVEIKTDNEICTGDKSFNLTGAIIGNHFNHGIFNNTTTI
ncbi:MAG: hypothetical protein ABIS01_16785, partial [Ferruginibacter sp.]